MRPRRDLDAAIGVLARRHRRGDGGGRSGGAWGSRRRRSKSDGAPRPSRPGRQRRWRRGDGHPGAGWSAHSLSRARRAEDVPERRGRHRSEGSRPPEPASLARTGRRALQFTRPRGRHSRGRQPDAQARSEARRDVAARLIRPLPRAAREKPGRSQPGFLRYFGRAFTGGPLAVVRRWQVRAPRHGGGGLHPDEWPGRSALPGGGRARSSKAARGGPLVAARDTRLGSLPAWMPAQAPADR